MNKASQDLQAINRPHYSYWQALYLSFFSSALYIDVAKRWRGFGIGYLLLLIFLVTLPFSARLVWEYDHLFNEKILAPLQQLSPPLVIQNGQVNLDKPMPYMIKNAQGQITSIIDTTGAISSFPKNYPDLSILITKDKLFYRIPPPQFFIANSQPSPPQDYIYEQKISTDINEVFTGETWVKNSGLKRVKYLTEAMLYPIIAILFFIIFLFLSLILGLMGQLVAQLFFKQSLTYLQAVRLLIVGSTAQIVFLILFLTLNINPPFMGILLLILVTSYFCFAVIAFKRSNLQLVHR